MDEQNDPQWRGQMMKWGSVKGSAIGDLSSDSESDDDNASVVSISARASRTLKRMGGALTESLHRVSTRGSKLGNGLLDPTKLFEGGVVDDLSDSDDDDDVSIVSTSQMIMSVAKRMSSTLSLPKSKVNASKHKSDFDDDDASFLSIDTDLDLSAVSGDSFADDFPDESQRLSISEQTRKGSQYSKDRQQQRSSSVELPPAAARLEHVRKELQKKVGRPPRSQTWESGHQRTLERKNAGKPPRAKSWNQETKQTQWNDTIRTSRRDSAERTPLKNSNHRQEWDAKRTDASSSSRCNGRMAKTEADTEGYESDSSPRGDIRRRHELPRRRTSQEFIAKSPLQRSTHQRSTQSRAPPRVQVSQQQQQQQQRRRPGDGQRFRRSISARLQKPETAPRHHDEMFGIDVMVKKRPSADPFDGYSDVSNSEGDFDLFLEPGDYVFDDDDDDCVDCHDSAKKTSKGIEVLARRARILAMGMEAAAAGSPSKARGQGTRRKKVVAQKSCTARTA